jgi:hypothetical protein
VAIAAVSLMGASFVIKVGERHTLGAALATDINSGHLKIYAGADPGVEAAEPGGSGHELLVDWTLNASNVDTNGVITLGTVNNVNASFTSTAGHFRITKSDGTTAVADGDVGVGTGSLQLNTLSIVSGGPCSLSGTITVPAGT